jgi:hypothetical protein
MQMHHTCHRFEESESEKGRANTSTNKYQLSSKMHQHTKDVFPEVTELTNAIHQMLLANAAR